MKNSQFLSLICILSAFLGHNLNAETPAVELANSQILLLYMSPAAQNSGTDFKKTTSLTGTALIDDLDAFAQFLEDKLKEYTH